MTRNLALVVAVMFASGCASIGRDGESDGDGPRPGNPEGEPDGGWPANGVDAAGGGPAACTLIPQGGCLVGACDVDLGALPEVSPICRPIETPGQPDDLCADAADCAAEHTCLTSTGPTTSQASCFHFCRDDGDCTAPGGRCDVVLHHGGEAGSVTLCTPDCAPDSSAGCPAGFGCYLYRDANDLFATTCSVRGDGGQFAACSDVNDCRPGYDCFDRGADILQCLRVCDLADPVCPPSTQCNGDYPRQLATRTFGSCIEI